MRNLKFLPLLLLGLGVLFIIQGVSVYEEKMKINEIGVTEFYDNYFLVRDVPVVIDFRHKTDYLRGHIPGSVPDEHCSNDMVPNVLIMTPVILVGDHSNDIAKVKCRLKYGRGIWLSQGIESWVRRGFPLAVGEYKSVLNYRNRCSASLFGKEVGPQCL